MEYGIFKETVLEGIKERIEDASEISIKEITKNNGVVMDGILISRKDSKIAPTFYINDFYDMYQNGTDFDNIIDILCKSYDEHSIELSFNPEEFEQFDKVKDKIMFKIVNKKLNEKLLSEVPHRCFLDLAICYYVLVKDINFENGSILINNSHAKMWDVDEETLFKLSEKNTCNTFKEDLMSMYDMMCELMIKRGEDEELMKEMLRPMDDKMYVLTNNARQYGASCIMYNDVLKNFSDEKNSDLVIIPSSVHEVIILSLNDNDSVEELNDMVTQVNADHVLPQEILSDHVYIYDRKLDRIKMC